MEDQRILHYFISTIANFTPVPAPVVGTPVVEEDETIEDPLLNNYGEPENQTNLLIQIAEETGDTELLDVLKAQHPVTPDDAFPPVQEEVETDTVLHQPEEVVEDVIEDTELPFDIDEDNNSVLDSILTPCAGHDLETSREIEQENSRDIFPQDETVHYTDPVGNTFEAPVVSIDTINLNETTKMAVLVSEEPESTLDEPAIDISDLEGEYTVEEAEEIVETIQERIEEVTEPEVAPERVKFAINDDFDLDFSDTESEADDAPDFF
jgi:hypothetical protein